MLSPLPARAHWLNSVLSCSSIRPVGPLLLWFQPIQHSGKRNGLANVLNAAHPCRAALDAHTESGMGHAAVATQIQIPFECFLRQSMCRNLLLKKFGRSVALTAANHFTVTLRLQHINA